MVKDESGAKTGLAFTWKFACSMGAFCFAGLGGLRIELRA